MTKTIITSYIAFLCMTALMVGVTAARASEVTGTLSSDASSNTQTTGSISGTVTSGGGGSSSGGRSNRSSSGSSTNAPAGAVLGASTSNTLTPGFPNAGVAPEEASLHMTFWATLVSFLKNLTPF